MNRDRMLKAIIVDANTSRKTAGKVFDLFLEVFSKWFELKQWRFQLLVEILKQWAIYLTEYEI